MKRPRDKRLDVSWPYICTRTTIRLENVGQVIIKKLFKFQSQWNNLLEHDQKSGTLI